MQGAGSLFAILVGLVVGAGFGWVVCKWYEKKYPTTKK